MNGGEKFSYLLNNSLSFIMGSWLSDLFMKNARLESLHCPEMFFIRAVREMYAELS